MKSALKIVAFSQGCELTGTIALLETALNALDRAENHIAAAYVDLAINMVIRRAEEDATSRLDGIPSHQ